MKLIKCYFFTKETQYLRHILSAKGIRPLPLKTQAINKMHPPKQLNKYTLSLDSLEIYQELCQDGQAINTNNSPESQI